MSIQNPYFYNDSPLIQEQVCYLLKKVAEQDKTFEEVKHQIYELDQHIGEIIEQYYKDGLFDEILNKIFDEWIKNQGRFVKTNFPTVKRVWRRINVTGVNDSFNTSECFAYTQGAIAFNYRNVIPRYCLINIKHTRPDTGVENSFVGLYDPQYQNPVGGGAYPIGHGQDITYQYDEVNDKSYLYVAHSSDNKVTTSNSITRIEMTDDHTLGDYVTKNFTGISPYQVSFYDGVLYMFANGNVYTVNWDEATYTYLFSLKLNQTVNGFLVNRFGIWVSSGESIVLFDMDGQTVFNYNLGLVSTDEFRIGEVESLSENPQNKNEIMFFSIEMLGTTSGLAQRTLSQAFVFNPIDNDIQIASRTLERFSGQHATLHIDGSQESGSRNIVDADANTRVNPDGSLENPFHTCQEAIDYFESLPQQSLELRLLDTDRTCIINEGMNIYVYPYQSTKEFISIGGILCAIGGTVRLQSSASTGLHIAQTLTQNVGSFQYNQASCNVIGASLYALGNVVFYYEASGYTTTTYSLRSYFSTILLGPTVIANQKSLGYSLTLPE